MRRKHDFYETPPWMTRALLVHVPEIRGAVMECCAGDNSITDVLHNEGGLAVVANDLDPNKAADYHFDASASEGWAYNAPHLDWVITNPPYKMPDCTRIVENAIHHARVGVAMMLRISFEEPTAKVNPRGPFLERWPLDRKLVMPRHSFTGNGKSDSTTTAWMIWSHEKLSGRPMLSLYRANEIFALPLAVEAV